MEREDLFTPSANTCPANNKVPEDSKSSAKASGETEESVSRTHYSESTSDVAVPKHVIQLRFDKSKTEESKIRSLAASRLNAELRIDNANSLLIFQSRTAAEKALKSNPLKDQYDVTMEKWTPSFFPTSMF